MSRRGNCWDNAPQESFFGHMKDEIGRYTENAGSYEELKEIVDSYMVYYNNDRYQYNLAFQFFGVPKFLPKSPKTNLLYDHS